MKLKSPFRISSSIVVFFLCLSGNYSLQAQVYDDYLGGTHQQGVTITTSDESSATEGLQGTGFFPSLEDASRFLSQASFGGSIEDIEYLNSIGIDAWLTEQFAMEPISYLDNYVSVYEEVISLIETEQGATDEFYDRKNQYLTYSFYDQVLKENDLLRQKIAFALSQLLVVSLQDANLNNRGFGLAAYYDILYQGAFGNYRDLLQEITLSPTMGVYLSHLQNKKADPIAGTNPDENFAREVMQLFTIGLYELNNDGSYVLDADTNRIATYDNTDITEMAKVFTGLGGSAWDLIRKPEKEGDELQFDKNLNFYDLTQPMMIFDYYHESGPKVMIDGSVLPAWQPGMQDISNALDVLFNHDNCAPFITLRLIQQLVKSNPTPEYMERVVAVFNNNGQGIKGDLQAVVRAILLDPEARECEWLESPSAGKLRQPLERSVHIFRAFDIDSPSGKLWFRDYGFIYDKVEQSFLYAPSVFNFFSPFFAESSIVATHDLVSPEFQILHATTGINAINIMESALESRPFRNRTAAHVSNLSLAFNDTDVPFLDFSTEVSIYENEGLSSLLDHLNLLLCHGQLSPETITILETTLLANIGNDSDYVAQDLIHDAIYYIGMSPNYVILK